MRRTDVAVERTVEELDAKIRQQLRFMVRSAAAYDQDLVDEAPRLAASVYMVYPLLQVRRFKNLRYMDSSSIVLGQPRESRPKPAGLVFTRLGGGRPDGFVPRLDVPIYGLDGAVSRPPLSLRDWWTGPAFAGPERDYSRGELITEMRNTDGGGHIDSALNADYADLLTHAESITFHTAGVQVPDADTNYAAATVRQIAHELLRSLQRDWRTEQLLGPDGYNPPQMP
jgi:hypothetical protein